MNFREFLKENFNNNQPDTVEVGDKVIITYGEFRGKPAVAIDEAPSKKYLIFKVSNKEITLHYDDVHVISRPSTGEKWKKPEFHKDGNWFK